MTKVYKFHFESMTRNQHYDNGVLFMDENGLSDESLRSCLIHHNADKQKSFRSRTITVKRPNGRLAVFQKNIDEQGLWFKSELVQDNTFLLQTIPKWTTHLKGTITDTETGEHIPDAFCSITDLESATKRKRKAIKKYSDFYEPLYQSKKVSCMFITLTQANVALSNTNIRDAINLIRKRFERHNIQVLAHLWVSEISANGHWHYHIAITTTRVRWKTIPKWAKFNDLWGRRTQIEFIRKSIASYLGKYIGKDNIGRMMGFRQYGMSRNLKSPIG